MQLVVTKACERIIRFEVIKWCWNRIRDRTRREAGEALDALAAAARHILPSDG
jgi:hypothetical protein